MRDEKMQGVTHLGIHQMMRIFFHSSHAMQIRAIPIASPNMMPNCDHMAIGLVCAWGTLSDVKMTVLNRFCTRAEDEHT